MDAALTFMAATTVSILRGSGTDAYGDPTDLDHTVRSNIPCSIRELRALVTTTSDGRPQQARFLVGRLPSDTDVRDGDRLRDDRTGTIYILDAVTRNPSAIMDSGIRLDLRRIT